jgi:predicted dehydrogenase
MKTIGIIGLGSIGMRHAKNLHTMGHQIIGYDPDNERRWLAAPLGRIVENIDDVMDAEAIVIASPTPNHFEHLGRVWVAGKPCLVEKPIADKMIHSGLPYPKNALTVGYNLRFHSCVKKAKEWLDAGLIGKPIWANFTLGQYSEKPPYLRDGCILNWSHEIDLALYLLGSAKVAGSSTRLTDGKDDMTNILLTHESGCRSTVHLDYITKPEQRRFTIHGSKASIHCSLPDRHIALVPNENAGDIRCWERLSGSYDEDYIEEMEAFISRIDGKETIGCSGEEGLEVLKICLEVRKQAGLT